jgi:hypothetical protein
MAANTPLPSRSERKAPKWDSQYEEQLPTVFEEYEAVAHDAGIENDVERMKKEVLWYVDGPTMRFWQTLESFSGAVKTWEDFKTEILENYPGAEKLPEANSGDLIKIVQKYAKEGISNTQLLAQYHREFATTAKSLAEHSMVSPVQMAGYYVQAFTESFRIHLDTRLQILHPNKAKGEPYSISDMWAAIDFLISDASTSVVGGNNIIIDTPKSSASGEKSASKKKVKAEPNAYDALVKKVDSLAEFVGKSLPVSTTSSNSNSLQSSKFDRPKRCFWDRCDKPAFDDCRNLAEWVVNGQVERD